MSISRRITSNSVRVMRCSSAMMVNRDLASSASGEAIPQARPSRKYSASCLFIDFLPAGAWFKLVLNLHTRRLEHASMIGEKLFDLGVLVLDQVMHGRVGRDPRQVSRQVREHDLAALIPLRDPHLDHDLAVRLASIGVEGNRDRLQGLGGFSRGFLLLADLLQMFDLGRAGLGSKQVDLLLALAALLFVESAPLDLPVRPGVLTELEGVLADLAPLVDGPHENLVCLVEVGRYLARLGVVDLVHVALRLLRGLDRDLDLVLAQRHDAQHLVELLELLRILFKTLPEALRHALGVSLTGN